MKKLVLIIFVTIGLLACKEEESIITENDALNILQDNKTPQESKIFDSDIITEAQFDYMYSLPSYNIEELKRELEKLSHVASLRSGNVWGIGLSNHVYKWNGTYWYQPNTAARLKFVEVSKLNDGSVWGIGLNNHVYRWNGQHWYQPNTAARLYFISPQSSMVAFGIGGEGKLFITTNGGINWLRFTNVERATWISSGDFLHPLTIKIDDDKLSQFNVFTSVFDAIITPYTYGRRHSSMTVEGGLWSIDWHYRVYKSLDGVSLLQPNPAARLRQISSNNSDIAWGIDLENKVYKTENSGEWWFQPNSAARLQYVSAAW
ncbi:hypothetical protein P8625_07705 [Tenacibaculum tangerinum]|uniref:Photosynthesis system II assembly factor Ycf48/Hcf136-like domain-containing protein n=1 Tax=Tenacibaculum tangerinum TaxID=3038772 RepID=A0ABY8L9U1_9FLAO|nr:tectonin domain-containing protein [Tenacibaculum tangerinum]WGH77010.1 hypothetical protein P8625_07705 [Tenacibaculum tangerinum]